MRRLSPAVKTVSVFLFPLFVAVALIVGFHYLVAHIDTDDRSKLDNYENDHSYTYTVAFNEVMIAVPKVDSESRVEKVRIRLDNALGNEARLYSAIEGDDEVPVPAPIGHSMQANAGSLIDVEGFYDEANNAMLDPYDRQGSSLLARSETVYYDDTDVRYRKETGEYYIVVGYMYALSDLTGEVRLLFPDGDNVSVKHSQFQDASNVMKADKEYMDLLNSSDVSIVPTAVISAIHVFSFIVGGTAIFLVSLFFAFVVVGHR